MENQVIQLEEVISVIYWIRNEKVILDRDLARLYGVPTKALKQAVKRNIDRFPEDFMFELSLDEYNSLRSQIVTLKSLIPRRGKHSKYSAFAFTEQGVAMLSSVLNSKTAVQMNIHIIRAFVRLRKEIKNYEDLAARVERVEKELSDQLTDHQGKIELIFEALKQLIRSEPPERKKIGYRKD